MYGSAQAVQCFEFLYPFFSTTFSIFTDLTGTAKGNIIELAVSLVNDIVNIQIASIINSSSLGDLTIAYYRGAASLSFICPNYSPSSIGGTGFGRNPKMIRVDLIGCLDSQAIRNLLTLRTPKDLFGRIRWAFKIISLTRAEVRNTTRTVAAFAFPDFIGEDPLFEDDLLYFGNGWPRVNQGRLPCVGIIIVLNLETGGLAAQNVNFLASCE